MTLQHQRQHQQHHKDLKTRQRRERDGYPHNLSLRIHRALSWLDRAEQCHDDDDARFIFLWIGFNAAYGNNADVIAKTRESKVFRGFVRHLVKLDKENIFYNLIWKEYSKSVRLILDNQYIFQPFWDFHNGQPDRSNWRSWFNNDKRRHAAAMGKHDTGTTLTILLTRLYTLRNQLVHGGATWNGKLNRDQLRDGVALLGQLVPQIIKTLMDHPDEDWGAPYYPIINPQETRRGR